MKFKDLLRDVWDSLDKEREISLSLMISYWPPPKELEILVSKIKEKSKETGKRRSPPEKIWEMVAKRSKLSSAYSSFFDELISWVDSLRKSDEAWVIKRRYRTRTRIVIGSGPTGWEVSMVQLLKPYDVPWIPGSSLKGAMESTAREKLIREHPYPELEEKVKNYKEIELNKLPEQVKPLAKFFGTKRSRGSLIVLGGFPVPGSERILTVDIISPHYKKYYESEGKEFPREYMEPVPLKFPAVREGTIFEFILLFPKLKGNLSKSAENEAILDLLDVTLTRKGIGGKINAGYGLFERM